MKYYIVIARADTEDVKLDKITAVRILRESSANETWFSRVLPRVFSIRHIFVRRSLDFYALSSSS